MQIDLAYVARHFLGRSYPTVMATIRKDFDLDLPPGFEDQYRDRLMAAFETGLRIMPGVRAALDRLTLPFCVATSSSPKRAEKSLRLVGLADLAADRLYTATMVAHGKPAPDLFLLCAARHGADPARCLVIEDSLTGVRAARAAGMPVWRFIGGSHLAGRDLDEPVDARPDRQFRRLCHVSGYGPRLAESRMSRNDNEPSLHDEAARAGWLYYVGGMTQDQIADRTWRLAASAPSGWSAAPWPRG